MAARFKRLNDDELNKLSRTELKREMANVIAESIMELIEQVVERRCEQWTEVIVDRFLEKTDAAKNSQPLTKEQPHE